MALYPNDCSGRLIERRGNHRKINIRNWALNLVPVLGKKTKPCDAYFAYEPLEHFQHCVVFYGSYPNCGPNELKRFWPAVLFTWGGICSKHRPAQKLYRTGLAPKSIRPISG